MKFIIMGLKLYVLACLVAVSTCYSQEKGVIVLTNADLANLTQTFPKILVEYYVPWCDHCKKLAPVYQQLAQKLRAENSPITIAKIDCEQHTDAYDFGEVSQFPALKFYSQGETIEFDGDRTLRYLYKWLTKRYKSPITKLTANLYDQLKAVPDEVKVVYLGHLQNSKGSQFTTLAYYDHYNDYYHLEEGVARQEEGTIRMVRDFAQDLSEKVQEGKLQSWVRQNDRPQVVHLDQRSIFTVFVEQRKAVLFFVQNRHKNKTCLFTQAAATWRVDNEAVFIVVEEQHEDYFGLMEYLELNPLKKPIVYIEPEQSVKYIMQQPIEELTTVRIMEFLKQVKDQLILAQPLQKPHQHDHQHHHHHDHQHHHHHDHQHYHHDHQHHHHHDHQHHDHHHDQDSEDYKGHDQDHSNCNHPDHQHDHSHHHHHHHGYQDYAKKTDQNSQSSQTKSQNGQQKKGQRQSQRQLKVDINAEL